MISSPPTVALVDPVWVGHHATYFRAFIEAFIASGARVLAICPHPAELEDLTEQHPEALQTALLEDPGTSRLLPGKDHDPVLTMRRWRLAGEAVTRLEKASGWPVDFVYFAWLDSYLRFMLSTGLADRLLGRPWTGLYFRSQHLTEVSKGLLGKVKRRLKGDFIMRSPSCRLLAGVDEQALPHVAAYSGKPVLLMPDITDETPGDPSLPLAELIRRRAGGRTVVGMVGLEKRKGFLTLLRAAQLSGERQEPLFFAFTGVLWWETLSAAEADWVRSYLAKNPENVHLDPEDGFVPDGEVYNGLASSFDIFFAAYLNSIYNGSSNVLTKAALLRKPVVVTDGACLEERVRRFRLGLSVPEDDPERCLDAIRSLAAGTDWEGKPLAPRYDAYFEQHSRGKLQEHVRVMLSAATAG